MPATATPAAPFGLKKDGTPRLRPGPEWMNDPAKVAAAAAKRAASRAAKNGAPAVSTPDAATLGARAALNSASTFLPGDLLARQRGEIDARLAELKPLVDEYTRLEAADAALRSV